MMSKAEHVAVVAAIGNLLQGWDTATIAGTIVHIMKEFNGDSNSASETLIVVVPILGACLMIGCIIGVSDRMCRRSMFVISSVLCFCSGLLMMWSPNLHVLLTARLLNGMGVGLAIAFVPVYISETAPPESRGFLNCVPLFLSCCGMLLSYCTSVGMSLAEAPAPKWRVMLGLSCVPSFCYFALTALFLPESPRWLVSQGRIAEAKIVLQMIRGSDDVAGEIALMIEGLKVGGKLFIEEYIILPEGDRTCAEGGDQKELYGIEAGIKWICVPAKQGTGNSQRFAESAVALFDIMQEGETEQHGSTLFPHLGSMFRISDWIEENGEDEWDLNLESPLTSHADMPMAAPTEPRLIEIGGGWMLGWLRSDDGTFTRVYIRQNWRSNSIGLVSRDAALYSSELRKKHGSGSGEYPPVMDEGATWRDMFHPSVKHAFAVGVGIQTLQQLCGINAVVRFGPLVLRESVSASLVVSGVMSVLMLACTAVAMRLLDSSGRRGLLIGTIPIMMTWTMVVIGGSVVGNGWVSAIGVVGCACFFAMGLGSIPPILCSEMFPTNIRGRCVAVCTLASFLADLTVSFALPPMLTRVGLLGVFAIYALPALLTLLFAFAKVPETKAMPIELIHHLFAASSSSAAFSSS